ncbi:cell division protein FtsA [Clostridium ragsdalei P11]|uniref:Chaperone protein DnaK n=1 Tax=Clostridium ragsdalei P11 TaxID=1353534 RepID=A0A1A6B3C5_9CLOT|nr:ethanolamine utilization protein EutJ [Clostridium ragsdalei]OBR96780.1 cell division protein FtsA [Clostridium ragsdalei P11]
MNLEEINNFVSSVEKSIKYPVKADKNEKYLVGVDLGTSYIVIVVLDSNKNPVACEMEYAEVVKDGLVVDFTGASDIVRRLKKKIQEKTGIELVKAAIAVPPGTGKRDADTHRYIVEGVGMDVTAILDEPTAANSVLNIEDGVVVDIGGGTTGLSIFENGKTIYTADEPTGGTHLSLVIAGQYGISFTEAEKMKKTSEKQNEIFNIVRPVIQKVASIIKSHIREFKVNTIYLVGGTCCLKGFESVIEKETGIKTVKPSNPLLVTPIGIALNCSNKEGD